MTTATVREPRGRHAAGPGVRTLRDHSRRPASGAAASRASTPRRVVGWLLVVALVALWFVALRPSTLGGPLTLVLVSGRSMEPGMSTGDLAVVRAGDDYAVGDVVAFRVPAPDGRGPVVIHRIVERTPGAFVAQGDNNSWVDPWELGDEDLVGELVVHLPGAGRVVAPLSRPSTSAALVAALVAFLVLSAPPKPADVRPRARSWPRPGARSGRDAPR